MIWFPLIKHSRMNTWNFVTNLAVVVIFASPGSFPSDSNHFPVNMWLSIAWWSHFWFLLNYEIEFSKPVTALQPFSWQFRLAVIFWEPCFDASLWYPRGQWVSDWPQWLACIDHYGQITSGHLWSINHMSNSWGKLDYQFWWCLF